MTDEEYLRRIADRINHEHDGAEEATNALVDIVTKHKEHRKFAIRYGCNRLIHDSRHRMRKPLSDDDYERASNANTTTTSPKTSIAAQLAVSEAYTRAWLEDYRIGDKRLGDCLADDLNNQISVHKSQVKGLNTEVRFLSKIVKQLPDDETTVREVFLEEEIEKLRG